MPPASEVSENDANLFEQATSLEALRLSWAKVRGNRGAAGGDGISVAQFEFGAEVKLLRLSHALRTGSYRPGPVRRLAIPKRSGGRRPLAIPSVVDRVAQGAVALTLAPRFERAFEDSSFAYRPGRSVADALARVAVLRRQGYTHVVDADIVRYFENVVHRHLLAMLGGLVDDPRLVDLVALWLAHHEPDGIGLPQGSPLSPLLANLYLDGLDEEMSGKGARIVRFADDFVILCRPPERASRALLETERLLGELGLSLHEGKTRIVSFDEGFRFLGHVLVKSMIWREEALDQSPPEAEVAAAEGEAAVAQGPTGSSRGETAAASTEAGPDLHGRWASRWRVLYILEKGRRLGARGDHFMVFAEDTPLIELPASRVDRIEIGDGVEAAAAALDLAAATDTEIVRVDGRGRTLGRWTTAGVGRARLHLAQAATVLEAPLRAALARSLVAAKIFNQRVLLKRLERRAGPTDIGGALARLARLSRHCERAELGVAEAMGREGEAAALYWPALAGLIGLEWAFAGKRRRRVGLDPFNVVVDLTSALLLRECAMALERVGLHTGFGILHGSEDGEGALSYDLAEEFRAPLPDALAAMLFARKTITEADFDDTPNGLRLVPDGYRKVVRGWEGWLARPIQDPASGEKVLWRGLVELQATRLAQTFTEQVPYVPYRMDY